MSKLISSGIILHLLILMSSCATTPQPHLKWKNNYSKVDKRVLPILRNAEKIAGYRLPFLKVRIAETESKKFSGLCHMYTRQITLPPSYLDKPYWSQEQTLLHEIGHCVLNRKHNKRISKNGCHMTIMHPKHQSKECYMNHRGYYLRELFEGIN